MSIDGAGIAGGNVRPNDADDPRLAPRSRSQGTFVVFEGADGSGKSSVCRALLELLDAKGRDVRVVSRSNPRSNRPFETYIRSVDGLFRTRELPRGSLHLLALAAAGQYRALLETEVLPATTDGAVVLAESWWGKTTARFVVEAERLGMAPADRASFEAWMALLLPDCDESAQQTVLITTDQSARVEWYLAASGPRDEFYGPSGQTSTDPKDFGVFTQAIQDNLDRRAAKQRWTCVRNGTDTRPELLAARIEEVLSL